MILAKETPSKVYIQNADSSEISMVKGLLTYQDKKVQEQIRRNKNAHWLKTKMGIEEFERMMDDLKSQVKKDLLFTDDVGIWTYPGLAERIAVTMKCQIVDNVPTIDGKLIPWAKIPHDPRYYQRQAVDALKGVRHGHVEIGTGGGKSLALLWLAKEMGLRTAIIAPSENIASQLLSLFTESFGSKYVGMFGGGKKQIGKMFTICIAQSVTRIQPETEEWEFFQTVEAMLIDESHQFAADTFESILMGPLQSATYRYFFSATQERNDGRDLMLEGLIGKCVYTKTVSELQAEGYLAKLSTLIFDVESDSRLKPKDPKKINQIHFYDNSSIIKAIGMLVANAMQEGMPTLILIDEHKQEEILREKLGAVYEYAHGKSDNKKIVEDFNSGKTLIVVGTSAVSIGTDFKPVRLTINWQGNQAGTKVKQGPIGRSTRMDARTGKTDCRIVDFRVTNIPILNRHASTRMCYYGEVGPVKVIKYG